MPAAMPDGRKDVSFDANGGDKRFHHSRSRFYTDVVEDAKPNEDVTQSSRRANAQTLDSPTHYSNRPGKIQKALGSFGNGLQKIVGSISSSSPVVHRRSRSVSRDDRHRTNHGVVGGATMTKSSTNGALDMSFSNTDVLRSNPALTFTERNQPGVMGLRNHGNTCFINAIVQCLSNTKFFLEYFLSDEYRAVAHTVGRAGTAQHVVQRPGALTEQLARVLRSLWSRSQASRGSSGFKAVVRSEVSSGFKAVVGQYGSQYEGTAQNDAQEFLLWLLDKLHEDRFGAQPNFKKASDHVNNNSASPSIIYDLFQAKYRSTLTCPNCEKQSNTYDPFLSVSLPIQQKYRVPIYVTIVRRPINGSLINTPFRIGLLMNPGNLIRDLKQAVAGRCDILAEQLLLVSIQQSSFRRTFHDDDAVADMEDSEHLYALETQPMTEERGPDAQLLSSKYITVLALNNAFTSAQRKSLGCPFVIEVLRDVTTLELQTALLNGMRNMLKDNSFHLAVTSFSMSLIDGSADNAVLRTDVDLPLYDLVVDQALSNHIKGCGPHHIKLILDWPYQLYKSYLINTADAVIVDKSVKSVKAASQQTNIGSLDDCFQIFTRQERLGSEDTWFCPNCRKSQLGTIKTLNLCSLPDVFIIHLKRFRQEGDSRTKLNTFIRFPINDLDMSGHIDSESCDEECDEGQRENGSCRGRREDYLYDLHAVCNHMGTMQGGHYTAFCKNPLSGRWFMFDDHKMSEMRACDVVTKYAYLLFYLRRTATSRSRMSLREWITSNFDLTATSASTSTLFDYPTVHDTDYSCDESASERSPRRGSAGARPAGLTRSVNGTYTLKKQGRPHGSTALSQTTSLPSAVNIDAIGSSTPVLVRASDLRASTRTNGHYAQNHHHPPSQHHAPSHMQQVYSYDQPQQQQEHRSQQQLQQPQHRSLLPSAALSYDSSLPLRSVYADSESRSGSRVGDVSFRSIPDPTRADRYHLHSREPIIIPEGVRKLVPQSRRNNASLFSQASDRSLGSQSSVDLSLVVSPTVKVPPLVFERAPLQPLSGRARMNLENKSLVACQYLKTDKVLQESSV